MKRPPEPSGRPQDLCDNCHYDLTAIKSLPPPNVPCPNCGASPWYDPVWERKSGFLIPDACIPAIGPCTKVEAIHQMVAALLSTGEVPNVTADDIMEKIWRREAIGTTGVGHCIAVPHTRHPKVERLVGCLAHSIEGVEYDSLDGQSVHLLMLYLIPSAQPKEAFRALALLERMAAPRMKY